MQNTQKTWNGLMFFERKYVIWCMTHQLFMRKYFICIFFFSVPPHWDFATEKVLAQNYSFQVYIISHHDVPKRIQKLNNTHVMKAIVTPNDYADFSRNSYGQQTLNDIMHMLGHTHLNLLRIAETAGSVQAWELLHFMINDNLLLNVHHLQLTMYIGKGYC